MAKQMFDAMRECYVEDRPVTEIDTLYAASLRLNYYTRVFFRPITEKLESFIDWAENKKLF